MGIDQSVKLSTILHAHRGKYLVPTVNPESFSLRLGSWGPVDLAGPCFGSSNRCLLLSPTPWASYQYFFKNNALILIVTSRTNLRRDICSDTLVFIVIVISFLKRYFSSLHCTYLFSQLFSFAKQKLYKVSQNL